MGEAKRRKQVLGKHYGQTPPVLIKGSETLQKQTEKFTDAFFTKFEQLAKAKPEEAQLEEEQETTAFESSLQQDAQILGMQQWVQEYFEPYRPKDREQLAIGLLEPFYFVLFEAPPEYFKEQSGDDEGEYLASLFGALTGFSILHPYLSAANLEEYTEPLRSLYWHMLDKLEDEERNTDDFTSQATNLTQLFQACLKEEDIPDYVSSKEIHNTVN